MEIKLILIPLLIFCARIVDVSIGTLRIIFISRNFKIFAAIFGFFEVLIWLVTITHVMQNLTNIINYIAYAGGFATGNFVGISIERKLSMGNVLIRIVTKKDFLPLIDFLKAQGYGVTSIDAQGATGVVKIILTVTRRKSIAKIVEIIKRFNPYAFYTIEDVRFVTEQNIYPLNNNKNVFSRFNGLFLKKK